MITVKPYSGLANRMRAIDSVLALTKNHNTNIHIIWECNSVLNCDFEDLFLAIPGTKVILNRIAMPELAMRIIKKLVKLLRKIHLYLPLGYNKYLFENELKTLNNSNYDFKLLNSIDKVYIESQNSFFENETPFRSFIPIPQIKEKIDRCISRYTLNTVGVHIRRGDNEKSIIGSPLEGFIELMEKEIENDKDVMFFLATDSIDTEEILQTRFQRRILSNTKVLNRNSTEGIQDALIDMMCLSKTRKILGSYWSSFSETAASIGNIELIVVKKK